MIRPTTVLSLCTHKTSYKDRVPYFSKLIVTRYLCVEQAEQHDSVVYFDQRLGAAHPKCWLK